MIGPPLSLYNFVLPLLRGALQQGTVPCQARSDAVFVHQTNDVRTLLLTKLIRKERAR